MATTLKGLYKFMRLMIVRPVYTQVLCVRTQLIDGQRLLMKMKNNSTFDLLDGDPEWWCVAINYSDNHTSEDQQDKVNRLMTQC